MSSKPVHIAQISDLHIKPPGSLAYGRVDTAKALERCVAALNGLDPAPDFVVITGDLADTPTSEEYDYLKRLLSLLRRAYNMPPITTRKLHPPRGYHPGVHSTRFSG